MKSRQREGEKKVRWWKHEKKDKHRRETPVLLLFQARESEYSLPLPRFLFSPICVCLLCLLVDNMSSLF